jgi:ferredoxin
MKLHADRELCVGAGMCALAAPDVFAQDDATGQVVLLTPDPSPPHETAVREAAGLCPSGAILIRDAAGSPEGR